MPAILILEDDVPLRETLAESLEDFGHEVFQAGNSTQALAVVGRQDLDLFLTDVRMTGPDGLETLQRALELKPNLRAIVMTGFADESAPPRAIEAGAWDYLYKPFSLKQLAEAIARVLGADREEQRYRGLLGRVVEGYRNLMAGLTETQVKALDKDRQRAFQGFYVSVRSRLVGEADAVDLWSELVTLEKQRLRLEGAVDLALARQVSHGYRGLVGKLARLVKQEPSQEPASRMQRIKLLPLLQGIEEGRISVEQLKLAPMLGDMRHETIKVEPELEELHLALWGDARS